MEHLPPWLRNLPLPPKPASLAGAAQDDVPDWLRELQSEVAGGDTPPSQSAEPAPRPEAFGATSWLAGLGADAPADSPAEPPVEPPPATPPAAQGDEQQPSTNSRVKMPVGATDWLRSIGRDPDLPSEPLSEPLAAGEESGVPDWLRDLSAEEVARAIDAESPAPELPAEPALPSWLEDVPADASTVSANWAAREPAAEAPDPGVPDWLRDVIDADAGDQPAANRASGADWERPDDQDANLAAGMEVPAWLRDLGGEADEPPAESAPRRPGEEPDWLQSQGEQPAAPWNESAGEDEAPDWLREAALPQQSPPAAGGADQDEAPDWLREAAPAQQSSPAAGGASEDDIPAWLREPEAPSAAPGAAAPGIYETPAWLRGAEDAQQPSATPDAGDIPAWLREAEPAQPAPTAEGAAAEEVPAWLREVETPPAAAALPAKDAPARLREAEAPAPPSDIASPGIYDTPAWLRGDAPAQQPPAAPGAGTTQDDVPAWLREAEAPPELPPAPPAEEEPAWLREAETPPELPPAAAAAGFAAAGAWLRRDEPAAPDADDDMPAWLREAEPGQAAPSEGQPGDAGVPSWLRSDEPEPPAAPPPDFGADEDVPAWLRESEPAPPVSPEAEAPTWLREAIAERQGEPGAAQPAEADIPPWLGEDIALPPPPSQQPVTPPPAGDLPAWLVAEELDTSGPAATAGDPSLPSWLRGVSDAPPPPPAPARPEAPPPIRPTPLTQEGDSSSFLKGAELPSWLRIPEPELPTESAEGQQLDWLRRLGGADQDDDGELALPLAAAALPARQVYQRSPEQLEAISLLRSLTQAPYPEPVAVPTPAPKTALERIGLDRILYALLALALILGLLLPQLTAPMQTSMPTAPGAGELGAALDALGPEDVVLVAYEWGAQRSGELRPLEQAIIDRLTADKVKLILVSTDLQGTLLSFDLREPLRAAGYNLEPDGREFGGRDYVLLGYRPGGELALRGLAQNLRGELTSDFTGQDASQGLVANNPDGTPRISGIQDLAMILVLADQPQDVQVWMEQVRPAARTADGFVPMAFVLPQEAQPVAQPYLRLDNVYHIAGLQGALALRAASGADTTAVAGATGQLWYSVLAFLVLLLLGALISAVARARGARARGGAA